MTLDHLTELRRTLQPLDLHPAVLQMRKCLLDRYGESVIAILFYGSCLHDVEPTEGLMDFYVIVDRYRSASSTVAAIAHWMLPPSVHYIETEAPGVRLRAKYAVFSGVDLVNGSSPRWFHGYISARLAQPVAVIYTGDDTARSMVYNALANAVVTLATRTLPLMRGTFAARDLWHRALQESYRTELRTERPEYLQRMVDRDLDYYQSVTKAAISDGELPLVLAGQETDQYRLQSGGGYRLASRLRWGARRAQGKLLSVLRLMKGLYTFDGGLDYLAWKLERHSGQPVVIPERVRRAPLLHIWGLFLQLYRRGVFR